MLRYQHALLQITIFIIGSGWLASTQSMAADSPSLDELREALRQYLPSHISIQTFVVEASQNIGTAVEPVITSRIKATLQIKEALYIKRQPIQGIPVIAESWKAGSTNETWYISKAELMRGKWQINFRPQGDEFFRTGSPRSKYPSNALLEHSNEYNARVANIKEQERQKQSLLQAYKTPSKVLHTFNFTFKGWSETVTRQIIIRDVNFEAELGASGSRTTIWFGDFGGSEPNGNNVHFGIRAGLAPASFMSLGRAEDAKIVSRALNEALAAWRVKYSELAR